MRNANQREYKTQVLTSGTQTELSGLWLSMALLSCESVAGGRCAPRQAAVLSSLLSPPLPSGQLWGWWLHPHGEGVLVGRETGRFRQVHVECGTLDPLLAVEGGEYV